MSIKTSRAYVCLNRCCVLRWLSFVGEIEILHNKDAEKPCEEHYTTENSSFIDENLQRRGSVAARLLR